MFDDYLKRLEESGGKNLRVKRRHLDQRLDTISTFGVEKFKKRRRDEGARPATINRELATLSHLLNSAVEWGWLRRTTTKIRRLDEGMGRIIALSDDEMDALMRAAVADSNPYVWLFVCFGLNTAMRHSEIMQSRFDQIDWQHNRLLIPRAKAGGRQQPITPELMEILRREREMAADPAGYIFPTSRIGTGKPQCRMTYPFARVVKAAGLDPKRVTPHTLRHTAVTNLVRAGVDLPTIQEISGHKTLTMVLRYAHVHGKHIDKAIATIGRTTPEPRENKPAGTTSQELHKPKLRSV